MKKYLLILAVIIFLGAIFILRSSQAPIVNPPSNTFSTPSASPVNQPVEVLANNLEIPWALTFIPASPAGGPNGNLLVTERPGRIKLIPKDGSTPILIAQITEVKHIGEGGLLGLVLHPDFAQNQLLYLYYTYQSEGDRTLNRVARYKFDSQSLSEKTTIVDAIPGASNHNGGRLKFGPDGFLYITTGDAQNPSLAQDKNSLAGKILRVTDDGQAVPGNPFNNLVYSFGHRNPQGLAWDEKGRLWATEHGQSTQDELNLIEAGKNYGWPEIRGDEKKEGLLLPIIHSGRATWAPSAATYFSGSIFFTGLRGQTLFEAQIENGAVNLRKHFEGQFGRLREVVVGPDGFLYLTTNNRDGRGIPSSNDDKILKIDPASF